MSSILRCWTCVRSLRRKHRCQLKSADSSHRAKLPSLNLRCTQHNFSKQMFLMYSTFWDDERTLDRPTTRGLQAPTGTPVQFGPSLSLSNIAVEMICRYLADIERAIQTRSKSSNARRHTPTWLSSWRERMSNALSDQANQAYNTTRSSCSSKRSNNKQQHPLRLQIQVLERTCQECRPQLF